MSRAPLEGRVLVTGAAGMLGSQLLLTAPAGVEPVGTDLAPPPESPGPPGPLGSPAVEHPGVDLTGSGQAEALLERCGSLAGVIHAAAYTAVDAAEEEEELARLVNAVCVGRLAAACAQRALPLVLVSTDFVFDGSKGTPYGPDDPTAPLGAYGRTKLEGEQCARAAHPEGLAIVRTQWLYGPRGSHFPGTIRRLAAERDELRVVSDQVGAPTSTLELAPALWDVLGRGEPGIYHAACEGQASWYDFAVTTLELTGSSVRVLPCSTEEFPRPAPRPAYSVLDCTRLTALRGRALKPWREALADYLAPEGARSARAPE